MKWTDNKIIVNGNLSEIRKAKIQKLRTGKETDFLEYILINDDLVNFMI
jgi:hypothetical protein